MISIEEYQRLRDKDRYYNAKRTNTVDKFRRGELASRVSKKYPLDKQIEILLSGDQTEITLLKSYRAMVSAEVDLYIKQLESESNGN